MTIAVTSRKFFNQLINSESYGSNTSDYTTNLTGGVMEKIRCEIEFTMTVRSIAAATTDEYTLSAGPPKTITRGDATASFIDDGWFAGDTFAATGDLTFTGTIVSVTDSVITYTLDTGTDTAGTYDVLVIALTSDYLAGVLQFGLIENTDSANFLNKVDGSNQMFTVSGLSSSYKTMTPAAGARSWITGDAELKRNSLSAGVATYTLRHEFIITPYYLHQYAANLTNGVLPDIFDGSESLKYCWNIQLRKLISDPNIQHAFTEDDQLGAVGWYNENYNGGANNYTVSAPVYTDVNTGDVVAGIQVASRTRVSVTITNTSNLFTADTMIGCYISRILLPAEYAANSEYFDDLWMYDNAVKQNNNTFTGLTGIIKRMSSTRSSATTMLVSFDVEYTAAQQAELDEDSEFIIAFQIHDSTLAANVSDRVVLFADLSSSVADNDVSGLLTFDEMNFLFHPNEEADDGFSNFRGWIEDGILCRFKFTLDLDEGATLEELTFNLIAIDTDGNEFTIQQFAFDLSSQVLVPVGSGQFKQAINLDTTRGFPLPTGDFFNRVKLEDL